MIEQIIQAKNEEIYADITEQVIDTANYAINFYFARPTRQSLVYVEDTLFDLVPFAQITTKCRLANKLVWALKERLQAIQSGGVVTEIDRLDMLTNFPHFSKMGG
ncbi:hypothetical protein FGD67_06390 [Colwellia sp. M166]|uniref:hypothetical protein n=1 Tax=Colwellia sp. M166 TaxID=2583805 RepID=UPI00211EC6E1|nr:hypothetical protein [Colwellia sp. M166]UUO22858.1 hypothetical protein FGD67_06390 [Colwellia sp. M166]